MAYITQEQKKEIHAKLKPILKEYKMKGSLAIHNHSTLVLTLQSGEIDFFGDVVEDIALWTGPNYIDVNPYHYDKHFTGQSLEFLEKVITVLNTGNWDNSDIMTDYFNVGWYVDVHVGKWDKPYKIVASV